MRTYDAVVVGGGPAGTIAAARLARAGWSVALVEKAEFPRRKVCGEFVSASNLPLLEALNIEKIFVEQAGPIIRQVGVFTGETMLSSPAGGTAGQVNGFGRGLCRQRLDSLMLESAAAFGVHIWQPWIVTRIETVNEQCVSHLVSKATLQNEDLKSRIVVAAHGSWGQASALPTFPRRREARGSDLLAFKAHFKSAKLPSDLMPLLVFPGGYGGMLHCDDGKFSFSCCIRRDWLQRLRAAAPGESAAGVVFDYVMNCCAGVREALAGAELEGKWMSAGPMRPGIRSHRALSSGVFLVGNAHGEAHPVIADGISMAMQSAWLLTEHLTHRRNALQSNECLANARNEYIRDWRLRFVPRICLSAFIANWATHPVAVRATLPVLRNCPSIIRAVAHISGKGEGDGGGHKVRLATS